MKLIVNHGLYGCETGCCGHWFELQEDSGDFLREKFSFHHPYWEEGEKEKIIEWAKKEAKLLFGEEHTYDLDWDNSVITDDC